MEIIITLIICATITAFVLIGCVYSAKENTKQQLSYAATALEASADNGDRYAARQIRDYLAALASGDEAGPCEHGRTACQCYGDEVQP